MHALKEIDLPGLNSVFNTACSDPRSSSNLFDYLDTSTSEPVNMTSRMAQVQSEPIAIVGSACRFPGGANSPAALWKLLADPPDLCADIPQEQFDTTGFYHPDGSHHGTTNARISYLLHEDLQVFDAAFYNVSPNEADSMDP